MTRSNPYTRSSQKIFPFLEKPGFLRAIFVNHSPNLTTYEAHLNIVSFSSATCNYACSFHLQILLAKMVRMTIVGYKRRENPATHFAQRVSRNENTFIVE